MSIIREEQLYELSVCTDCVLAANGYDEHEIGHKPDREPWGLVTDTVLQAGGSDGESFFSWVDCEGCGSTLGGDRFTATLVDETMFVDDIGPEGD